MMATIENRPMFNSTTTILMTLATAQTNSIISARMRRISQLPTNLPTIKKPKAMVKTILAVLSSNHP